jgi:hypothetical protein
VLSSFSRFGTVQLGGARRAREGATSDAHDGKLFDEYGIEKMRQLELGQGMTANKVSNEQDSEH